MHDKMKYVLKPSKITNGELLFLTSFSPWNEYEYDYYNMPFQEVLSEASSALVGASDGRLSFTKVTFLVADTIADKCGLVSIKNIGRKSLRLIVFIVDSDIIKLILLHA